MSRAEAAVRMRSNGAALSSPAACRCGRSLCWLSLCTRSRRLPRSSRSSRSLDGRGRCSRRPTAASRTPACHRAAKAIVRAPRSVTQLSHVRARILLSHATERCCIRAVFFNYIFLESENDPKNDPVIIWCVLLPKAASRRPRALADCRRLVSGHTAGTTAALAPRPCSASSSSWARTTSTRTAPMIPSTTRPASRTCSAIRTAGRRSPTWCVPMVVSSQSLDG